MWGVKDGETEDKTVRPEPNHYRVTKGSPLEFPTALLEEIKRFVLLKLGLKLTF